MKNLLQVILCMLFLLSVMDVAGQGSENRITGLLVSEHKDPLIGATVQVLNDATGFKTGVVSDVEGRFTVEDLPLGGPYELSISYLGYSSLELKGYHISQGDYLDLGSLELTEGAQNLEQVVVTYNSFRSDKSRLGTAKKIDSQTMSRIPSASRNYKDLSALSPLTRGTVAAGSKSGMTGYMLDGVSNRRNVFGDLVGGAFPLSMEAVREFEVTSNGYDVTNGRGGGSVIKAVTKSGTNDFHGSAFGYYSGKSLTGVQFLRDNQGERLSEGDDFTNSQIGVTLGGPIVKDKLHFFISADFYTLESPYTADDFDKAGSTLIEAEQSLGITKQNMDEVVSILEGNTFQIPVPESGLQYGTITTKQKTGSILGKLDYRINDKNLLTLRYNYHSFHNPRKRKGLLSTQYEENSYDHSFLLSLRTQLSQSMTNDLKISYANVNRPNELIFDRAPVGRVNVGSTWEDGTSKSKWVYWGNQYWIPEIIGERNVQLVDNLKFQKGKFRYTVGMDLILNQVRDNLTHYQQGEFFYDGIEALRNNTPYRYERKTPIGDVEEFKKPRILEGGFYGQVETTIAKDLNFTAGLRWDATYIPVKPTYNETLFTELGLRNDATPFDGSGFQPRLNLIWDVKGKGTDILKLGAGMFVSQFTTQVLTMTHIDNGVDYKYVVADATLPGFTEEDLPSADWPAFFEDFDKNVPGEEYLDELTAKGLYDVPASLVVMLDENLKTPKTWKINANYYHYFNDWLNAGVGFYYNSTRNNYYFENRNLKEHGDWQLASEGNRDVYVPLSTLTGQNQAKYDFAKRSESFTQVLEFTNADWANSFIAFVAELNMELKGGSFSLSYTRGASKGGTRYNSGNTREYHFVGSSYQNWGHGMANYYDAEDLRNKVVFSGISPSVKGFTLSATFIGSQANRFSAGIGGGKDILGVNINDPGNNVILPYIFDPADPATPGYLADGINNILATAAPEYADYIRDNIGQFAEPYGGVQPWQFDTNVSLVKTIKIKGDQRVELRADIFNFFNLLSNKWGGYDEIYNTDIYSNVSGFDEVDQRWNYNVNANAGQKRYRVINPYQVHLGLKYAF